MRFRLCTLLLLMAVLPPLLALGWIYWMQSQPAAPAIQDDPYEIIWDDYAPDTLPPQQP